MPKQCRSGYTFVGLLGLIALLAVLSSVLLARLGPPPVVPPDFQGAWLAQPDRLPPRPSGLAASDPAAGPPATGRPPATPGARPRIKEGARPAQAAPLPLGVS